jgi:hypothetical protein
MSGLLKIAQTSLAITVNNIFNNIPANNIAGNNAAINNVSSNDLITSELSTNEADTPKTSTAFLVVSQRNRHTDDNQDQLVPLQKQTAYSSDQKERNHSHKSESKIEIQNNGIKLPKGMFIHSRLPSFDVSNTQAKF